MAQSIASEGSTQALSKAADVLRSLNPSTVGSLLFLIDEKDYEQGEVADKIGYSRSSVSKAYKSLNESLLQLAIKRGNTYEITSAGKTFTGYLNGMAERLGVDLHSLDWQSKDAHGKVASLLAPLCDSRDSLPFFVFDSIATRSAVGEQVNRHNLRTPQQVRVEAVVEDVDVRQQERGEHVTPAQIRKILHRFEEQGAVKISDNRIQLAEKGKEHALLLNQVVQLIEKQAHTPTDEEKGENGNMNTETDARMDTSDTDWPTSNARKHGSGGFVNQIQPHGFFGKRISMDDREERDEHPNTVPVYCLRPSAPDETGRESPSGEYPSPVLPITRLSIGELINRVQQLGQEYDLDREVEPYWMIRMGTELYPMESADEESSAPHES
jgi:biotin operon repressor/Fe2+ or Zn2+ uptake regulation protein